MSPNKANVTKRACDGCKIRKIRCGGGHPCKACTNARIRCTYIRVQQSRGPQRLRSATKLLIEQTQSKDDQSQPESTGEVCKSDAASSALKHSAQCERSRIPIDILAPPLYTYHVRMYPVWPIVNVEHLVSTLQDIEEPDLEAYALATAVAAAIIAQLRLGNRSLPGDSTTADTFATECLRIRSMSRCRSKVNLNNVRTSFFLHVYYENQQSGGTESLLYLREAISLAQMANLHRESSYAAFALQEQQLRCRVLWLLFVTERGVCILHKLPVVLKTNVSPPESDANDEPQVLPAFLKLLNLFRLFERSKMFEVIENEDLESDNLGFIDDQYLKSLQDKLEDSSAPYDHISDVQKADLCVTRHWMRMILWKLSSKRSILYHRSSQFPTSPSFPVGVAKELLNIVSQLPRPAIEAHGLGMELKLYEIANSLADSIMKLTMLPRASDWEFESQPSNILSRLHSILSTFRGGGNKALVDMLYKKMAEAESRSAPVLSMSLQPSCAGLPLPSRRLAKGMEANSDARGYALGDFTGYVQAATVEPFSDGSRHGSRAIADVGFLQDDLYTEPMVAHSYNDCQQTMDAQSDVTIPDMSFSLPWMDPGSPENSYMAPTHTTQAPVSTDISTIIPPWPSYNSMESIIGDFLSQVPRDQPFRGEDLLEHPVMGEELVETNPLPFHFNNKANI